MCGKSLEAESTCGTYFHNQYPWSSTNENRFNAFKDSVQVALQSLQIFLKKLPHFFQFWKAQRKLFNNKKRFWYNDAQYPEG